LLTLNPDTRGVRVGERDVELSRREFTLLRALMESAGRTLTPDSLQDKLYGLGEGIESNALVVHIHNLRRKLATDHIQTVRGVGYRLVSDRE
jgi:DNA-binding response OmpR family regulator